MTPAPTTAKAKAEKSVVITSRAIRCTRLAGGGITIAVNDGDTILLAGEVTLTGAEVEKFIAFARADA